MTIGIVVLFTIRQTFTFGAST